MTCSSLRLKIAAAAMLVNLCPLLATPAQIPADSTTSPREFLEKARASIVIITGEDKEGLPVSPGIGFWIGWNFIATDKRVIQSAVRLRVTVPGKESTLIKVTSRQSYRFATVLTVTAVQGVAPLPLGDSDKSVVNDKVYVVGDSASGGSGAERSLEKSVTFNGGHYFQVAAPVASAARGGPVLNGKGEVIGIAGEGLDGLSENLVIPVAYLTPLLRALRAEEAGGIGPGGGIGPAQGSNEGKGMGMGSAPSTGPGQGSNVDGGNAQSGGQQPVDTKPVLLKNVQPRYTEEARKNGIQGVVTLRIYVGEDGSVKQVRIIRGLPDGLNERAIEAAYQIKFKPAMRNGVAVPYWLAILVEFNLK